MPAAEAAQGFTASWSSYLTGWLDDHVPSYLPSSSQPPAVSDGSEAERAKDLLVVVPLILIMCLARFILDRTVFRYLARWYRIQSSKVAPKQDVLEKVYGEVTKAPSKRHLQLLARQLSWRASEVKVWFRRRGAQERPSMEIKFRESLWRFLFYTSIELYAWNYINKTNWIWDGAECWKDNRSYVVSTEEYVHYLLEMAFYGSLVLAQFSDVKRKDFLIMFIHHNITMLLIVGSYCHNMTRIGALTLLYHDISDIFLEAGKLLNYIHWERACSLLFVLFAATFMLSRLVLLPIKCAKPVLFDSDIALEGSGMWNYYAACILLMLALHLYWTALICNMVKRFFKDGKVSRDIRSDVDSSSEEEEDTTESRSLIAARYTPLC